MTLKQCFLTIPPIFILIGLMDVWIKKEIFIKHMGEDSGFKGIMWAFILGTIGQDLLMELFQLQHFL